MNINEEIKELKGFIKRKESELKACDKRIKNLKKNKNANASEVRQQEVLATKLKAEVTNLNQQMGILKKSAKKKK